MAKELGLSPKALIKNIPAPNQGWKLPVKYWVRELHEKRFGKRNAHASLAPSPAGALKRESGESQGNEEDPF